LEQTKKAAVKPQLFCRKAEKSRLMNQTAIFPQRAGKE